MRGKLKILLLHPIQWALDRSAWPKDIDIRHVSIGGKVPRRANGPPTMDGIGDVVTDDGLQALYRAAEKFQPDVFFFGIHHGFDRTHLARVKNKARHARCVMHYTDQRPAISRFVKVVADKLDLLLVTNYDKNDHKMYDGLVPMVRTFYDGVCPREYWPKPTVPAHECFFGGNNFWRLNIELEKRKHNVAPWIAKFTGARLRDEFLLEANRHFDLLIRGEWGWDKNVFNVKKPRFHPRYLDVLRNTKIILSTVNSPRYGLLTRRMFRSLASGRLYVTEYSPGMEEAFCNHHDLVWFHSAEEGVDVVRYYLDRDSEREKIARQGRESVIKRFTWNHRLHEFVDLIRKVF